LIAKQSVFGAPLHARDVWRRRALACVFKAFHITRADRRWWCRKVLEEGRQKAVAELLDLRKSQSLWEGTEGISADLHKAYRRALRAGGRLRAAVEKAIVERDWSGMKELADSLTRLALARDWLPFPLVVIDEVHNLKNTHTQVRRNLETYLTQGAGACR